MSANLQSLAPIVYNATDTEYSERLKGGIVTGLSLMLELDITATGGGTVTGLTPYAPAQVLSTNFWRLVRGGKPIVQVRPEDLYHMSSLYEKYNKTLTQATPGSSATAGAKMAITVPIKDPRYPWGDEYWLDARQQLLVEGNWGVLADYASTNMATIAGSQLLLKELGGINSSGNQGELRMFTVPKTITEDTQELVLEPIPIPDTALWRGLLIRQRDVSAAGSAEYVDGLVKSMSLKLVSDFGEFEIGVDRKVSTAELRERTIEYLGIDDGDLPNGLYLIPFDDPNGWHELRFIEKGASLEITLDMVSAPPAHITDVTPQVNVDNLLFTFLGYAPNAPLADVVTAAMRTA